MTRENDELKVVRRLVVVFDICSSTTILEDLKRTDNLAEWRNLLIGLKEALLLEGANLDMELYKFIGDGWVLLFPYKAAKDKLCHFLSVLSMAYAAQFEASIGPLLSKQPNPIGLTFGIDAGELIRLEMNENVEYLGRAINVAARLQSSTKDLPGGPVTRLCFPRIH
jgi:class 3 adenylate cyclase